MIIPKQETTLIEVYHCPVCDKKYRCGMAAVTCAVKHAPGTCCHYQETEVSLKQLTAALKALEA